MILIVTLANVWNMRMRDRPACIIMIMFTIKRKEFNNKSQGVVWSGPKWEETNIGISACKVGAEPN